MYNTINSKMQHFLLFYFIVKQNSAYVYFECFNVEKKDQNISDFSYTVYTIFLYYYNSLKITSDNVLVFRFTYRL